MSDPVWRASRYRRFLGIVTFVVGSVVWLLGIAFASLAATYGGLEYKCAVDGPHDARAYPPEAGPVSAQFSMWPLGRECVWPTAGGGTVVAQPDGWGSTIGLSAVGGLAVVGAMVALVPLRPQRDW
jgi:hypothetical protein